jgi:kumamolisin
VRRNPLWLTALSVCSVSALFAVACRPDSVTALPHSIPGVYAALLGSSTDLGPSEAGLARVTATLGPGSGPTRLTDWARGHGLSVRWRGGQDWAVVEGSPPALAEAFSVVVHDYRNPEGRVFYASPQQPQIPDAVRGEVTELGRILGFTPFHDAGRWMVPLDVPGRGLSPDGLRRAYNVTPLTERGFTGKGVTVVVFAFDGVDQADLDQFSDTFALPRFTPETLGDMPSQRRGEATMDLEAIHAIAPDARTVLANARVTVEGDASYEKIATLFDEASRRYPGAVWSLSIGWGCDKLVTAADLAPIRAALVSAHKTGTTAFDASGDLAGLECKGGDNWSTPPGADEIGLDAIASIPEMTDVGGTTLNVDRDGNWLAEQTWFDVPLSQGTGGGVSNLYERPTWQYHIDEPSGENRRLTPDISGISDPDTGVNIVFGKRILAGGGTSLATPIWAGVTAVMTQYLVANGGQPLGDLNPLLYEVSQGARLPGFHDVPRGANAVDRAHTGYDLVTGLGSPNVANLAEDLAAVQRSMNR